MSKQGLKRYSSKVNGIKKQIRTDGKFANNKCRIICNLIFDGSVYKSKDYHHGIMYVNSSIRLINQFIKDMKEVYNVDNYSLEKLEGKNIKHFRVKYTSKNIFEDLLKYIPSYHSLKANLPPEIIGGKRDYKLIALRSFWDNEGSIGKNGRLMADLKNFELIQELSQLHSDFKVDHYISRYWKNGWAYKLVLNQNKENYSRFETLEFFSDSIVTKGKFIGRRKLEVLNDVISKKKNWT